MADNKAQNKQAQEPNVNELIKVRYDKLAQLQENGKDPFAITKFDVTNHSTDVKDNFETMEGKRYKQTKKDEADTQYLPFDELNDKNE